MHDAITGLAGFVLNEKASDFHPYRVYVHCRRRLQQGPEPHSPACQPGERHHRVKTLPGTASSICSLSGHRPRDGVPGHVKQKLTAALNLEIVRGSSAWHS